MIQPYMNETYKWMHQHIEHVRPFFATNGGPIIMTQVRARVLCPCDGDRVIGCVWVGLDDLQ